MSAPHFFYLGQVNVPPANTHALGSVAVTTSVVGNLGSPWAVIVNNRPGLLFICSLNTASHYNGWMLALFDDDGSVCTYVSSDYPGKLMDTNLVGNYTDNVIQIGNSFNFSRAGFTATINIPTLYRAGEIIVVPYSTVAAIVSPCGAGTFNRSVWLPNENLIAYEFSQAFAQASNVWVSFYQGQRFAAGGYLGNYPSAYDPFFRYSDNLPPNISASNMAFKNGSYIYTKGSGTSYGFQTVGGSTIQLNGDPYNLVCGGSGNPTVNVTAVKSFNAPLQANGIPARANGDVALINSNADIPLTYASGCILISAGAPIVSLFNQFQWLDIGLQGVGGISGQGLSSHAFIAMGQKQKLYFFKVDGSGDQKTFYAYGMDFNQFPVQPANFQLSQFDGLMNYHRAVSPTGNFQA